MSMSIPSYKIIVIGQSGVGKSSLLRAYLDNVTTSRELTTPTVGTDVRVKSLFTGPTNSDPVNLHIWDTAGQEKFESITISYYRGSLGVIICFSLVDPDSINSIERYITLVKNNAADARIILVGTFLDKVDKNIDDVVYDYVDKYNIKSYVKISNRDGTNIETVFNSLVKDIYYSIQKGLITISSIPSVQPRPIEKPKSYCCSS